MKILKLNIPEVILFEPNIMYDSRGFFFESYNQKIFEKEIGSPIVFVQDNHSKSRKGVLRGLHYQLTPKGQGKLVRVIQGKIFDVAVDVRESSPTFGKWTGAILSSKNKKQLWIPEGFAHGFLTLSKSADVLYKTTNYYFPKFEKSIAWNDKDIGISWPMDNLNIIISEKDSNAPTLKMQT